MALHIKYNVQAFSWPAGDVGLRQAMLLDMWFKYRPINQVSMEFDGWMDSDYPNQPYIIADT